MSERREQYIRSWLWTGVVLVCLMVVIGGITRLTGSGLSMVEWRPITGIVPPLHEEEWNEAFEHYQQFPEYQKLNYSMSLAQFKQIFFWEYIHRLLGRVIGLVFIIPFLIFYFKGWLTKEMLYRLLSIFLIGGLQGVMGWYMVKSGLINTPHVSHFRLAAHQSLTFLLIAALLWTIFSLRSTNTISPKQSSLLGASIISLVLLVLQVSLGALVAGLKAGFSYTNFPLMGSSFFPPEAAVNAKPTLYNGVLLQFTHRWLAFAVAANFVYLFYLSRKKATLLPYVKWLVTLGALQILLGVITLMMTVPVVLGVAHQLLAVFLFMLMIKIVHKEFQCYRLAGITK